MSEIVKLRTRAEIEEQAALWIWRLESGQGAGGGEREVFESWLREDPRHRRAVEELSKVWGALDILADAQYDGKISAHVDAPHRPPVRNLRPWWLAAAAAVVIAIGSALWLREGSEIQTLATAVGQHRNVTLADGSIVTLNTNTIVETDIGGPAREVYLRKGEAHFEVAHDRSRPFLVHAGDAVVRAVGTEFEVRLRTDQHVDVLVNEGRVEVRPETPSSLPRDVDRGAGAAAVVRVRAVSAGERLTTSSRDYAVSAVSPAQLSSDLAWREGAIVFDSEPLSEAVVEIERYTDARIVVNNPDVADLRVGGRFKTDDLQGFLDGLEAALPVTVRRTPDGAVYIEPR